MEQAEQSQATRDAPDESLISAIQEGSEVAFKAMVGRYQKPLYAYLYGKVRNHDDSADLLQQVFLQVHRKCSQYQTGSTFKAWLYTIANNLAKNYYRSVERRREEQLELEKTDTGSPDISLLSAVAKQEKATLHQALKGLPARQKVTVELRIFRELSFDEVAQIMGITTGAAKANFHHGMNALRQKLTQEAVT